MRLSGRRALITGAGAGIGRELALRFAAAGADIVAVDWNAEANRQTAQQVLSCGGVCRAITADVSSESDIVQTFAAAGPLDILVNNAAFSQGDGIIADITSETWDRVLAVCLKSVFLCTREALKNMVPARRGAIVNISSVNAMLGIHLGAYSAAKGGIISFTRVTAVQYARFGVRANVICPGTILSESSEQFYKEHPEIGSELRAMYPAGEFGTVGDVAEAALFLASDRSQFINGAVLPVDGALTAVHRIASIVPLEDSK